MSILLLFKLNLYVTCIIISILFLTIFDITLFLEHESLFSFYIMNLLSFVILIYFDIWQVGRTFSLF